jgi:flagellum-specific ATP synthase
MLDHMKIDLETVLATVKELPSYHMFGRVSAVQGLMVEVSGIEQQLSIGGRCTVLTRDNRRVPCEVVGFRQNKALLMAFGSLDNVGLGCKAELASDKPALHPTPAWLGRVINALGEPIDGKGPLPIGPVSALLRASPPPANARQRVAGKVDLGVRALNTFVTLCKGQRLGIFAASGVGKSVLMSMLARYTSLDVNVIGLIGERGREVQEFIEDDPGRGRPARSIVVVATSDDPALMRRQAAHMTMALAEYFRDQGQDVLCMMDSVTRFAMASARSASRLASRPPPRAIRLRSLASCPSCWSAPAPVLPDQGSITGLFTVLVEGDDTTNRLPMRCAVFSTGISCWNARSPSAGAIRRY